MNYIVDIMPQAKIELADIAYFIALDNEEVAKTFTKGLVNHFVSHLSIFPELWENYSWNIRKITHKGYTAFYRIKKQKKTVEILHISNLKKPFAIKYRAGWSNLSNFKKVI